MPHLIIEYTDDNITDAQATSLVDCIFVAVENLAIFELANIKVRAMPVSIYRLGVTEKGFVHVQCRIHSGRTESEKKRLTEAVVSAIREKNLDLAVITAEVVEMNKTSYSKYLGEKY